MFGPRAPDVTSVRVYPFHTNDFLHARASRVEKIKRVFRIPRPRTADWLQKQETWDGFATFIEIEVDFWVAISHLLDPIVCPNEAAQRDALCRTLLGLDPSDPKSEVYFRKHYGLLQRHLEVSRTLKTLIGSR
jgi:hypothetical protein